MPPSPHLASDAFHALHAVYHERDFRVRVNDPTINMVRRILASECNLEEGDMGTVGPRSLCPACQCGFDYMAIQPNDEDRR